MPMLECFNSKLDALCPALHADGPQRATRSHPARGPEYGNVAAKDGWPTIPGAQNLWEMFHNR